MFQLNDSLERSVHIVQVEQIKLFASQARLDKIVHCHLAHFGARGRHVDRAIYAELANGIGQRTKVLWV